MRLAALRQVFFMLPASPRVASRLLQSEAERLIELRHQDDFVAEHSEGQGSPPAVKAPLTDETYAGGGRASDPLIPGEKPGIMKTFPAG
jgi:hypothetical protein